MSISNYMNQDDNAHLLRVMQQRISQLERNIRDLSPTGSVTDFSGTVRLNKWSETRADAVGSAYTRWWDLNEVNEAHIYHERNDVAATRLPVPEPLKMGQPGLLPAEGGYSLENPSGSSQFLSGPDAGVVTGQRDWSLEAIFRPTVLPQTAFIVFNGTGSDGYGIYISNATLSSPGSLLVISSVASGTLNTGVTLTTNNFYHVIAVADGADNTMKWYLGSFNPINRTFSYQNGSIAMPTPPAAPSGPLHAGEIIGYTDDFLIYNGKISGGTARGSAEDRIRTALEPRAPNGWLPTTGEAVARNRYGRLFTVIGTRHGAGDGSTTFNLPNVPGAIIKT